MGAKKNEKLATHAFAGAALPRAAVAACGRKFSDFMNGKDQLE